MQDAGLRYVRFPPIPDISLASVFDQSGDWPLNLFPTQAGRKLASAEGHEHLRWNLTAYDAGHTCCSPQFTGPPVLCCHSALRNLSLVAH